MELEFGQAYLLTAEAQDEHGELQTRAYVLAYAGNGVFMKTERNVLGHFYPLQNEIYHLADALAVGKLEKML